jgi:hypothetical protein
MTAAVPNMTITLPNIAATVRITFRFITLLFLGKGGGKESRCPLNRRPLGYPHYRMVITVALTDGMARGKAENG